MHYLSMGHDHITIPIVSDLWLGERKLFYLFYKTFRLERPLTATVSAFERRWSDWKVLGLKNSYFFPNLSHLKLDLNFESVFNIVS